MVGELGRVSTKKSIASLILHDVKNPREHFIKEVDVKLNGSPIITQKLTVQDTNNTETVAYVIPDAKIGDTITIKAECSISGKLEKSLKVE